MNTNYGKIAFQKTEDIFRILNVNSDNIFKCYNVIFKDKIISFGVPLFSHDIKATEGSTVTFNINIATIDTDFVIECYVNGNVIQKFSGAINQFSYLSSGKDNIYFVFTSDTLESMTVNKILISYYGMLKQNICKEPIYFDDNMTYCYNYYDGTYTRYSSIDEAISNYSYQTSLNEFYSVNSVINGTNKLAMYGLYNNQQTGYLTLKYFQTGQEYGLINLKVDDAIFMPQTASTLRVFYLYQGKVYLFTTSKTGTAISSATNINMDNLKVLSLFPIKVVAGNTSNFFGFGVVTNQGAYIVRYNSSTKAFDSKKYIGKCEYASGYYDKEKITINLYDNLKVTSKTYIDRMLTNLSNTKVYYNYLMIYNVKGTLLGLNYNGLSKIV